MSGRRGSNPRPIAWKAIALPTELLPHNCLCNKERKTKAHASLISFSDLQFQYKCGQERIRTSEVERQRIYSPPHLAALEPAHMDCLTTDKYFPGNQNRTPTFLMSQRRDSNPRPADYKSAALPTELLWRLRMGNNHMYTYT